MSSLQKGDPPTSAQKESLECFKDACAWYVVPATLFGTFAYYQVR